jgi:hypothetical protein
MMIATAATADVIKLFIDLVRVIHIGSKRSGAAVLLSNNATRLLATDPTTGTAMTGM